MKKYLSILLTVCFLISMTSCVNSDSGNGSGNGFGFGADIGTDTNDQTSQNDTVNYADLEFHDNSFDDSEFFEITPLRKDSNEYKAIKLSSEDSKNFIKYIKSIDTKYSYSRYYKLDQALEKYESLSSFNQLEHKNILETITIDTLFERVKENNLYYKNNMESYLAEFYEDFSDEELKSFCAIIARTANYYLAKVSANDKERALCNLSDLKIFNKYGTMSNAYVADDNCMLINPSMIETLAIKNLDGTVNVFFSTIAHETIHVMQKGCNHTNKICYSIGNSYKFNEMDIHPLFNNWFYEGSAELLGTNFTHYKPMTYEYYIYYINSFTYSVLLNKNNDTYGLEETTLSPSLDPLFDYFSCSTDKEKEELLTLLFTMEFIETDDPELKQAINENMSEDELVSIKRNMKNSVCETLTKYFYATLADNLSNESIPLNDIFYYITVFEHDVNSHIDFTNPDKKEGAKDFIRNYTEIQNTFFDSLAKSGTYSDKEIAEMFENYGLIRENGEKNFFLKNIPNEKTQFISKLLVRTYDRNFTNIRSYS